VERIFVELMTSDRKLKASREGSGGCYVVVSRGECDALLRAAANKSWLSGYGNNRVPDISPLISRTATSECSRCC